MDGQGFDRIVRGLTNAGSRRQIVGGVLGGAAALLTGAAVLEAKRGGNGKSRGNAKGRGKAKVQTKLTFCHSGNGKKYTPITVASPAQKAHHDKHGDELCALDECNVAVTGCSDEGACQYEAASAETECTTEDGVAGFCDGAGACVATPVEEE